MQNLEQNLPFQNFNFNASHHGDYVGIASESVCLVGLDILSLAVPQQETTLEFIKNFSSYFTVLEWKKIVNAGTSDEILAEFCRYKTISLVSCMLHYEIFHFISCFIC